MNIVYCHEPTDLQCGQAVLAMILGTSPEHICEMLGNERETTLREMCSVLTDAGLSVSEKRIPFVKKSELPPLCFLSLETPRCWHWSLYCQGTFYDPEHGVLDDLPECNRRYFWEVSLAESCTPNEDSL